MAPVYSKNNQIHFRRLTIDDGLLQNSGECFLEDSKGFLWIGTQIGLSRYDGYQFVNYLPDHSDPESLGNAWIGQLLEDERGGFWVGTIDGLYSFDRDSGRFRRVPDAQPRSYAGPVLVSALIQDRRGSIWVAGRKGLELLNRDNRTLELVTSDQPAMEEKLRGARRVFEDSGGRLWISTEGGMCRFDPVSRTLGDEKRFFVDGERGQFFSIVEDRNQPDLFWLGTHRGLVRYNLMNEEATLYRHDPEDPSSLGGTFVNCVFQDRFGRIWVGLDGGGVSLMNPEAGTFRRFVNQADNVNSLPGDVVTSIYEHSSGTLWLGARLAGMCYYENQLHEIAHYRRTSTEQHGLSSNTILSLAEDKDGALWVGTSGGGLNRQDPGTGHFRHYRADRDNPRALQGNRVTCLSLDRDGNLWVASRGIARYDAGSDQFQTWLHDPSDPQSISTNGVNAFVHHVSGAYYVGTYRGVERFDPQTGIFKSLNDTLEMDRPELINALFEDRSGALWVGYNGLGVRRLDVTTGQLDIFEHDPHEEGCISGDSIYALHQDGEGRIWLGTNRGLSLFHDTNGGKFTVWRRREGLPDTSIFGILEDDSGRLWMSTNKGLAVMDPETEHFKVYDRHDGLQSDEFNQDSYARGASGILYFGGVNGVSAFMPEHLTESSYKPPLVLTRLLINNKQVFSAANDPQSPLDAPIDAVSRFTLNHLQNNFSFEFAALDLTVPGRNRYAYMMEGFNDHWVETDADSRHATFTNLPEGVYTFRVKGSNHDGVWNPDSIEVRVRVKPHPLLSVRAKVLYVFSLVLMVAFVLVSQRRKLERERMLAQEKAERERQVAEQLRHLDRLKDDFIANTSHELRTPLNGIIGLSESLVAGAAGTLPSRAIDNLAMIASSGKRLASLVDDLLDFAKVKNQELLLNREWIEPYQLVASVITFNKPLAAGKDLTLINSVPQGMQPVFADEKRLSQVLYNLIGNAVKFTTEGSVTVAAREVEDEVMFSVQDTGIGIDDVHFERIFQSFEQADGSIERSHGGTGLGLAISKQLLELHGGRIWVASTKGEGSTFFFTLPKVEMETGVRVKTISIPTVRENQPITDLPVVAPLADNKIFRVLLVDDDAINRQVLVNFLSDEPFDILQAGCGAEALKFLEDEKGFDLVLLDVMMPGMSGHEVCARLRERFPINELPVIFLTARARSSDMIEGFKQGANDFLPKPVTQELLLTRVRTQLQLLDINRNLEAKVSERTRDLIETQKVLLEAEHMAGMAEIATDLLHNVGNRLNSLGTSLQIIEQSVGTGQPCELLRKIADLMLEHQHNLAAFLTEDPRAARIPDALDRISSSFGRDYALMAAESHKLREHMAAMSRELQAQQENAIVKGPLVPLDVNKLIHTAVHVAMTDSKTPVDLDLAEQLPKALLNESRFIRTLLYLLQNARDAVEGQADAHMKIKTRNDHELIITISDNGLGIEPRHMKKIYTHGFSTKDGRKGFGLHYCANAVREMNGRMTIESGGAGQGTRVLLAFPIS